MSEGKLVMLHDSGSVAEATDAGRKLGTPTVQLAADVVIRRPGLGDGPAIEAMFQWVRGNRDDREMVVVP
jgi:hypothetical protein